jgi:hypothetical protein
LDTENLPLAVGVGLLGLVTNIGVAFVVGVAVHRILPVRGS